MPVVKVRDLENNEVGEIELKDSVFAVPLNKPLIYDAVKAYLANQRQGTSSTKTRGETSGSGRKLWRQKGTGRARVASLRSPLWKGGGNVHGPKPRDWGYRIPKKMRRGAICSVLSERLREGGLIVVDNFQLPSHKTKVMVKVLAALGISRKALLVDLQENRNLTLSSRNIPGVKRVGLGVNVYDLLLHDKILISREAVMKLQDVLSS
ncbi:MAG: 50S ribosomal protein L4 [Acidobacteriota bacterium]|nr:50S ribosomal protein L4 [Blastocatellia bacterium]MDW8412626.1 50S ribosomal protein L4 [Acidobacteriota bacterium]